MWLPIADQRIAHSVMTTERRWVALSREHRLADLAEVDFGNLLDEPFVALPTSAETQGDLWLGMDARDGHARRIAAEAATAEEKFELIASGLAVSLISEGNVALYARPDIVCRPVRGLAPCHLAVAWRREDRRQSVSAFVEACMEVIHD